MKIPFHCFCIFLSFALSLTACQKQSEKPAGSPEKINIAYSTAFNAALVHIAFAKGFFRDMPNYLYFIDVDGLRFDRPESD